MPDYLSAIDVQLNIFHIMIRAVTSTHTWLEYLNS